MWWDSGVVAQSGDIDFILATGHVVGSQTVDCPCYVIVLNIAQTHLYKYIIIQANQIKNFNKIKPVD